MKKSLFTLAFCLLGTASLLAQNQTLENRPNIEVTGTAKQEVIPDEIYVSITLRERSEGKDKITIEEQEMQLKKGIESVGVPLERLSLSDTESDYIKVSIGKKEVITSKQFSLKLDDAESVGKVFQKLDELKIQDAYIARVDHSQIVELRKELRIKAIKAAKEKADYLLEAIGEETGQALIVRENSQNYWGNTYGNANYAYNSYQSITPSFDQEEKSEEIQFQKIKLEASVYVMFEIKP